MYTPAHFAADEQAVDDLLTHHGAADLITATPAGMVATTRKFWPSSLASSAFSGAAIP